MRISEGIVKFEDWKKFNVKANTIRGYCDALKQFCLYMHDAHIEDVELDDVMHFLNELRRLGSKQNGMIPKTMALRKFFGYFLLQGKNVINPALVPVPKRDWTNPRVVGEEEYKKLLKVIEEDVLDNIGDARVARNLAIVKLLWDTGARIGEILSLNVSQLDFDNRKALIKTEKGQVVRPIREIFWTYETNEVIKKWLRQRARLEREAKFFDKDALFVGCRNWQTGRRSTQSCTGIFLRKYSYRAGIRPAVNAHSFRHHMGHDIIHKGGSNSDVMNILGHASLTSSRVYTQMQDKELEARYRHFKGR